jgi:hypothetical protein
LEKLGDVARPALRRVLEGKPNLEVRRRVEALLKKIEDGPPAAEEVGALRAVEVLEALGTAEARRLLEDLARGDKGARLTQEAGAALQRLGRRLVGPRGG